MALILILGLCTFAGLFAIILFILPGSTAECAMLDQVTRDVRDDRPGHLRRPCRDRY